jgi:2-acylglycerol O-acyltransferase 2
MPPCKLRHTIGAPNDLSTRAWGAFSFLLVWGLGEFVGPLSPLLLCAVALTLPWYASVALLMAMGYAFVVPEKSLYSPAFCRFALLQAGWIKNGASLWVSDEVQAISEHAYESWMVCYHPHGLIPCGFVLNGALRARAKQPGAVPSWLPLVANCSGVQAPVLFNIPILRHILLSFGCCVPATKQGMHALMKAKTTFGIIPGGSEECSIHVTGEEHLYLRKRMGFIKYALQYGYTVVVAFTFGESDLYRSLSIMRPINLFLVKRFGFILPLFAGCWFCPLLPRTDVELHTVVGKALSLPRIDEPSAEDIEKWHGIYMVELEALYEEHKAQFGYAGRKLYIE